MTRPTKVAGFLDIASPGWDLPLLFVMGAAIMAALPVFQLALRQSESQGNWPLYAAEFQVNASSWVSPGPLGDRPLST